MYLSEESKSVEIVSSKSSEMNVSLPKVNGDYVSFQLNYTKLFASILPIFAR